jgi:hypothetical protein
MSQAKMITRAVALPEAFTLRGITAENFEKYESSRGMMVRLIDVDRKIVEYTNFLASDTEMFSIFLLSFNYQKVNYQACYLEIVKSLRNSWTSALQFPLHGDPVSDAEYVAAFYRAYCFRIAIGNFKIGNVKSWDIGTLITHLTNFPTFIKAFFVHLVDLNLRDFSDFMVNARAIEEDGLSLKNTLAAMGALIEVGPIDHNEQERADASGRAIMYEDSYLRQQHVGRYYETKTNGVI